MVEITREIGLDDDEEEEEEEAKQPMIERVFCQEMDGVVVHLTLRGLKWLGRISYWLSECFSHQIVWWWSRVLLFFAEILFTLQQWLWQQRRSQFSKNLPINTSFCVGKQSRKGDKLFQERESVHLVKGSFISVILEIWNDEINKSPSLVLGLVGRCIIFMSYYYKSKNGKQRAICTVIN